MPESIETISAGSIFEFVAEDIPTAEEHNQNPTAFRSKINELIAAVNRQSAAIRVIGSDATVAGKVYRKNGTSLALLQPNQANMDAQTIGIGTGGAGQIQDRDLLTVGDLGFSSYPTRIFLGADGSLVEEGDINTGDGYWYVPLGVAESATVIKIEINRDDFMKYSAASAF